MKKLLILSIISISIFPKIAFANDYNKKSLEKVAPYPKPDKQQNRNVIWLDKKDKEENYKVEVYAEKKIMKDCNSVFYGGEFNEKDLQGWGYSYYVIKNSTTALTTLVGCIDKKPELQYVPVNLPNSFLRYNSKLPIVIYAPKDVKVTYKIWTTNEIHNQLIIQ